MWVRVTKIKREAQNQHEVTVYLRVYTLLLFWFLPIITIEVVE